MITCRLQRANKWIFACLSGLLFLFSFVPAGDIYHGTGSISFTSSAPLETIKASSDQLKAILDLSNNSFAFSLPVKSFNGFNSPLQKEHFNEHYMETSKYPKSTFVGKMVNFRKCEEDCEFGIIAKGKLTIHGITKVVTIPVQMKKKGEDLTIASDFTVQLADFGIEIPLILEGKISPSIDVAVHANFFRENE